MVILGSHFYILTILALAALAHGSSGWISLNDPAAKACQILQETFPQLVSFPRSEQYESDIEHWAATSTQNATCSIEPETADDVSIILKIMGRSDIRAPFAVKGGGHAYNVGQSSTTGVQISMAKFTDMTYDSETNTVTIGTGLTWDQVYSRLEPLGVMVVGGRTTGPGVAGLSIGGGYSWKTNQFGLTIDTIVSHNIVLPSGQQVRASNASYSDLSFGLKGGLNNFGIVTNITFEAHPQGLVYGGTIIYNSCETDALNVAISNFSMNSKDPKAQIIGGLGSDTGQFASNVLLFYDGPTPPPGTFDAFLSIPSTSSDVKTRSFVDLLAVVTVDASPFSGAVQHTVPVTFYTTSLLSKVAQEVDSFGKKLAAANNGSTVIVGFAPEPFFNSFSHSKGGAYPHPPSRQVTPGGASMYYQINLDFSPDAQSAFHELVVSSMKEFTHNIQAQAVAEGVSRWDDILYPNYALDGTPLELMYGSNVQHLREIASKYDPDGIMKLTGGPHF